MLDVTRTQLRAYSVTLSSVALALGLTLLVRPLLNSPVFALFYAAVALSAWYGGVKTGLLATLLSWLCIHYFLVLPPYTPSDFGLASFLRLIVFIVITGLITSLRTTLKTARSQAQALQQSQARSEFLTYASDVLASSLDYEVTIAQVARLAVPFLADFCLVDLLLPTAKPGVQRVAVAHADPDPEQILQTIARRYPPRLLDPTPLSQVLDDRQPILLSPIPAAALEAYAQDAEHLRLLQAVGPYRALIIVPLIAREQILGALTFGTTHRSDRYYDAADLAFAEELAHRIALAIDNARLCEQLHQEKQAFQTLLENSPDLITRFDSELRYLYVSPAIAAITGIPVDRFLGSTNRELGFPQELCQHWHQGLQTVFATQQGCDLELEFATPEGIRHYLTRLVPEFGPEGCVRSVLSIARDLTHYKQGEQERLQLLAQLESRQRLLETVMGQMPAGIMMAAAPSGRLLLANAQVQQMFPELPPTLECLEQYMQTRYQICHPDGRSYTVEELPLARSLRGAVVHAEEVSIGLPDGSQKTLLVDSSPIYTAQGHIEAAVVTFYDISERKQVEQALRRSEERFRQLIENVQSVFWISKPSENKLLYVSPSYEKLWGRACETLYDNFWTWIEAIHPDDRAAVQAAFAQLIPQGQFEAEYRVVRPDGSIRWVRDRGVLIWDETGKTDRATGIAEDITEQKTAAAALRESEERFRAAQELSLDAFTILQSVRDASGTIVDFAWTYANPKAVEILQRPAAALIGQRLLAVLPGNKENSDLFERYVQVVETGEPHDLELSYNSEGIQGWFRNMAVKLADGVAVSFADITRRKQAEQEREELLKREQATRAEAEAANRIKDEFLAVLSHELRSPLNPILGWAKLLRSRSFDAVATDRALEVIERNAKLQAQLIEDLLDVSRILRGKLSLNISRVNLATTIEAALETVQLSAEAKAIHLITHLDAAAGWVCGDASRLQQVVWNLLSNAVKFTPLGGHVAVHLEKVTRASQDSVQITVRDTGQGIKADFLPYVFDYFRQADSSTTRVFGGLGLGLAIVRHIVELHGGTVAADSPGENQGATFIVQLPLAPQDNEPRLALPALSATASLPQPLAGVRILAVDDEADMREYLACVLEQAGAVVVVLGSAEAALALLSSFTPDLLLSDIGMPGVDGYSLVQRLRSHSSPLIRQIPAIALTAYAGELNQKQAIAAGFQFHLAKPVEPDPLIAAIVRLLNRGASA